MTTEPSVVEVGEGGFVLLEEDSLLKYSNDEISWLLIVYLYMKNILHVSGEMAEKICNVFPVSCSPNSVSLKDITYAFFFFGRL